jgi:hypothetical protein
MLDLLPAPSDVSFHGLDDKKSSWGGSVLQLPVADGKTKWAMFAAEMTRGCTLRHWTTNSEVVVALADSPTGPYTEQFQIIPPWAHNPEAILTKEGEVVIFTLGDGKPVHGPEFPCDAPPSPQPKPEVCTGPKNTTTQCASDFAGSNHPCPSVMQPICLGFVAGKSWGQCCAGPHPPYPAPTPPPTPGNAVHDVTMLVHHAPVGQFTDKAAWKAHNATIKDFPKVFKVRAYSAIHSFLHSLTLCTHSFLHSLHALTPSCTHSFSIQQWEGNWNPAPVALPDGRVRVMAHTGFSGFFNESRGWSGEVIIEAASWEGPYKMITSRDITNCTHCEEDPVGTNQNQSYCSSLA